MKTLWNKSTNWGTSSPLSSAAFRLFNAWGFPNTYDPGVPLPVQGVHILYPQRRRKVAQPVQGEFPWASGPPESIKVAVILREAKDLQFRSEHGLMQILRFAQNDRLSGELTADEIMLPGAGFHGWTVTDRSLGSEGYARFGIGVSFPPERGSDTIRMKATLMWGGGSS